MFFNGYFRHRFCGKKIPHCRSRFHVAKDGTNEREHVSGEGQEKGKMPK